MLINLTPHSITIITESGTATVLPSGQVARVAATFSRPESPASNVVFHGEALVPLFRRTFGSVEGLPAPVVGVVLIVSALVAQANPRTDVVSPGELVRDANGQPVGCRGLVVSM